MFILLIFVILLLTVCSFVALLFNACSLLNMKECDSHALMYLSIPSLLLDLNKDSYRQVFLSLTFFFCTFSDLKILILFCILFSISINVNDLLFMLFNCEHENLVMEIPLFYFIFSEGTIKINLCNTYNLTHR